MRGRKPCLLLIPSAKGLISARTGRVASSVKMFLLPQSGLQVSDRCQLVRSSQWTETALAFPSPLLNIRSGIQLARLSFRPNPNEDYFSSGFIVMYSRRKVYHLRSAVPPDKRSISETKEKKYSTLKGLLFATIASIFFSTNSLVVKSITNLHPVQLSLYQFIAFFVINLPQTVKCGECPFGPQNMRIFLILRGILGACSICLSCMAYRYLPLGESAIITSSTPIFVTVAAWLFLKEPFGVIQFVIIILTVIGIIFTTKVPSRLIGEAVIYTTENITGILAAFGVLFGRTCQILLVRKVKKVHHSVMMFNFGWVAIIQGLITLPILIDFKWHRCGMQWIYILLIGVFSYSGQTFQNLSLKCELAGPVSTMMASVNITLSFLMDTFFFHEVPDHFSITGAVIVGLCIILAGVRKWASSLPENSANRKRLTWILI